MPIDGVPWLAGCVPYASYNSTAGSLYIAGLDQALDSGRAQAIAFFISLPQQPGEPVRPLTPGTYQLGGPSRPYGNDPYAFLDFYCTPGQTIASATACSEWEATSHLGNGTITITSFTPTGATGISEHTDEVCDASRQPVRPAYSLKTKLCRTRAQIPSHGSPSSGWRFQMVQGLGTVIYHVTDLGRAKTWYAEAFRQAPYFDEPFYVGFNIAGYELGLDPNQSTGKAGPGGSVAYWRVPEIEHAVRHFVAAGASVVAHVQDVGEGIKVATVADPFGNPIGLIENPHFEVPKA
jgi:predicted enzyme related to lactoylglutathione lyase